MNIDFEKNLLSKVDENIENINNLNNKLTNYSNELSESDSDIFLTSYNKNYIKSMKIITENTLDIQIIISSFA